MTDTEVQLLLFDLALIIVLARVFGALAKRIGQPPVIGEIVAGLLLGPTIWGSFLNVHLFPPAVAGVPSVNNLITPLTALANLGLAFFMFVVGYEVDLSLVRGREKIAASVAIGSMLAPLVLGIGLAVYLAGQKQLKISHELPFVLFFGVAMSITAFPVLARILTDRGLHRTRVGGLALAAASVDDVLAWGLLAVVIAIAGASTGQSQWHLYLVPAYAIVMIWLVRPLLRRLADMFRQQGRLTPTILASVLALLLLSCAATDWMGVKFIFGAFIFGIVMPRDAPELREAILERLEQVSVLVLLPVFFVLAGLKVDLRTVGVSGLAYLGLIMVVAVAGKFGGAYLGARMTGMRRRQSGALATLMNTRGLTELVILAIGLQLGVLPPQLYSLMVVMAIITTAMAGPLLHVIYPDKIMERDIAEADQAALGEAAAHRIVVLIDDPGRSDALIEIGTMIAASRSNSELVLSHLVEHQPAARLEVGAGIGGELLAMTQRMSVLKGLAGRAETRGVPAVVQSRFSEDVTAELPGFVSAADPQTIVLAGDAGRAEQLGAGGRTQLVFLRKPLPPSPSAAVARVTKGSDSDAAVQVAAQLSIADGLGLVLASSGRAASSLVADLARRGIAATTGTEPDGAIVVGPAGAGADGDVHLAVVAGTKEASDDMDQWVAALDGSRKQETNQS